MIEVVRYDPDIKRLRTFIDRTDDIQWYTRNNLYPQIVEAIRDRSYTVKPACEALADFIRGEGFEDASFADLVVNPKGDTMNGILKQLAPDAATFKGSYVAHLSVNLLGEFNSLSIWPLAYWRFGLPDENGDVHDYKYNSNWEQDPYKEVYNYKRIVKYPKLTLNKESILEQMAEYAERGEAFPGFVFYFTTLEDQYPLATFDPVLDQAQTQEEIGMFRLASIQNGLNANYIVSHPGKFENKQKETEFKEGLSQFKGGEGAGSIIVIEDESAQKKAADLVTPLTVANNDKIHEFISRDNKEAIMEVFSQPKAILGVMPETGMFNQQEIVDGYYYYNMRTRNYRSEISDSFKKIFSNWHQPVSGNFKIKELQYTTQPSAKVG